jgi:hypothetical protein
MKWREEKREIRVDLFTLRVYLFTKIILPAPPLPPTFTHFVLFVGFYFY